MQVEVEPDGWRIPIHQSVTRPKLLLFAERPLVLAAAGICALPVGSGSVTLIAFGLVCWIGILFLLQRLAKKDPIASETVPRLMNYPLFMPAQPSIIAAKPPSHEQQQT